MNFLLNNLHINVSLRCFGGKKYCWGLFVWLLWILGHVYTTVDTFSLGFGLPSTLEFIISKILTNNKWEVKELWFRLAKPSKSHPLQMMVETDSYFVSLHFLITWVLASIKMKEAKTTSEQNPFVNFLSDSHCSAWMSEITAQYTDILRVISQLSFLDSSILYRKKRAISINGAFIFLRG